MLQQLINHSTDLRRLTEEGFILELRNNFLLVHRIPYVNSKLEIKYGIIVSTLQLTGFTTIFNPDHTVYFVGEEPCNKNGVPLHTIINNSNSQQLWEGFTINHYFSSKPLPYGYKDYHQKKVYDYFPIHAFV